MPGTEPRIVCIDLDDTLIATSHLYHQAIWECGGIIHRALGVRSPYPSDVMALFTKIDTELFSQNGFVKNRFPESLVRTYVHLAESRGMTPSPAIKQRVRKAAMVHRQGPFVPLPGAQDALRALRADGHRLHLVTMGEPALQRKKIRESGFRHYFDSVHVTGTDKRGAMERCIKGRDPSQCVMIGDSKRSDVAPAISLGMVAVWILGDPWPFAKAEIPEESYHRIDSIAEAPAFVRALT